MIYRFGDFELDTDRLELRRRGKRFRIEPLPLRLLMYLVENRGRTIPTSELKANVWKASVAEVTVSQAKSRLAKTLRDQDNTMIRALDGGYRFIAAVEVHQSQPTGEDRITVGRDAERERLLKALNDAIAGRGSFQLLQGEHGLGKSHLLHELEDISKRRHVVVFGSSNKGGDPVQLFSEWVKGVIAQLTSNNAIPWRHLMTDTDQEIVAVLTNGGSSALEESSRNNAPAPDSDQERQAAIRAFTSFSVKLAASHPLLLVFDDLHEADRSLCEYLVSLAGPLADTKCLVVGAYRRGALLPNSGWGSALGTLEGRHQIQPIQLKAFSRTDIATYLSLRTGCSDERVVDAIYARTEGNPLFAAKVVGHAKAEGLLEQPDRIDRELPQNVQDAILRQITHRSAELRPFLERAAVLGREFDPSLLPRLTQYPHSKIDELLEEATRAQILAATDNHIVRYAFQHGLVRDTIYNRLRLFERARIHAEIVEIYEDQPANRSDASLVELAHHAYEGALAGTNEKAVSYSMSAAQLLRRQYAYEESARHYRRALDVMGHGQQTLVCRAQLGLAEVLACSGAMKSAEDQFWHALSSARSLESGGVEEASELFVRAVLGLSQPEETVGVALSTELIDLLEQSLSKAKGLSRVRVLGRLAVALYWAQDVERGLALAAEAVRLARELGDPGRIAMALLSRRETAWSPSNLEERLQDAEEVIRIARSGGHRELLVEGLGARIGDTMEIHGLQGVQDDIRRFTAEVGKLQQPRYLWRAAALQGLLAWSIGNFAEADAQIRKTADLGSRTRGLRPEQVVAVQTWRLRADQGMVKEIKGQLETFVETSPRIPAWRCALAHACCEIRRRSEAARHFSQLAATGFTALPPDRYWIAATCLASEVCAALGDRKNADVLYNLLHPYADRYVVVGPTAACLGSVARYLGLLASTMKRWSVADAHFQAALKANAHIKPMLVRTQYEYASMLLKRGRKSDKRTAHALLTTALAEPVLSEMRELKKRVRGLRARTKR